MDIFDKAVLIALRAHEGQVRKNENIPYFLHPAEAASIAATLTDDREVLAAVILHDTVEDTDMTLDDIRREMGDRVAELVSCETEEACSGMSRSDSWRYRKERSLNELAACTDRAVKIMWLSDKLSNMRSFFRQYLVEGDAMWLKSNHSNVDDQAWYYRTIAEHLSEFGDTPAYRSYIRLMSVVFPEVSDEG